MTGIWHEITATRWLNNVNTYLLEITDEVPLGIPNRIYNAEVTKCGDVRLVQPPRLNRLPFATIDDAQNFIYNWIEKHGGLYVREAVA